MPGSDAELKFTDPYDTRDPARRRLLLLGPGMVVADGTRVGLRPREHHVVSLLGLEWGRWTSPHRLANWLWNEPPTTAHKSIQNHVARARSALGADAIETYDGSYRLGPMWACDLVDMRTLVASAANARVAGHHVSCLSHLREAVHLLRGDPLETRPATLPAGSHFTRLLDEVVALRLFYVQALLDTDNPADALRQTQLIEAGGPHREHLALLQSIALARTGERRSALGALSLARTALRDTAGLSPGHALKRLETLLLADDPAVFHANTTELVDSGRPVPSLRTAGEQFFVGRRAELDRINQILIATRRADRGRTIIFTAPPGSGRSSFARRVALLAMIEGWTGGCAACSVAPVRQFDPMHRLLAALSSEPSLSDSERSSLTELRTRLDSERDAAQVPVNRDGGTAAALVDMLAALARHRLLVLVIDDAQWLGSDTAGVLAQLRQTVSKVVVILVGDGVAAGAEALASGATNLELLPFTPEETAQLYSLISSTPVDLTRLAEIHIASRGMPPMVRHAAMEDSLAGRSEGAVGSALDRLDQSARRFAVVMAVVEGPVGRDAALRAAESAGVESTRIALSSCVAVGIVSIAVQTDTVHFGNDDLRRELLAGTDAMQLIHAHNAWLHSDDGDSDSGALRRRAHHALATVDHDPTRAMQLLEDTAAVAALAGHFSEAAEMLGRAIEVGATHDAPLSVLFRQRFTRCEHLRRSGAEGLAEMLDELITDASTVGDTTLAAQAVGLLCNFGESSHSDHLDERVVNLIDCHLPRCEDFSVRSRTKAQASLFYSLVDYGQCRRMYLESVHDARIAHDDDALAFALSYTYIALTHPDDWDARLDAAHELLSLSERLDDDGCRFEALYLLFSCQLQRGDPSLRATLVAAEQMLARAHSAQREYMAGQLRRSLLHVDGRGDDAIALAQASLKTAPVAPSRAMAAFMAQFIAVRFSQARSREIRPLIAQLVTAQPNFAGWTGVVAWAAAVEHDWDAVAEQCQRSQNADSLPRDISWLGTTYLLGRATAAWGDPIAMRALERHLEPHTGRIAWAGHSAFGIVDLALAELAFARGDQVQGMSHLDRADHLCRRLHAPAFYDELVQARRGLSLIESDISS